MISPPAVFLRKLSSWVNSPPFADYSIEAEPADASETIPDLTMPSVPLDPLPRILADLPVGATVAKMLQGRVELLPWEAYRDSGAAAIEGVYTYGHPTVDGALLDCLPGVRVISNFGVGVDHIDVAAAAA